MAIALFVSELPIVSLQSLVMHRRHLIPSLVILVVLGLQAMVFPLRASLFWPFLAYPMYSIAYHEAFYAQYFLYAELADDREIAVTPEYTGLAFFAWEDRYRKPLTRDVEGTYDAIVELVERREDAEVARLRMVSVRHEIEGDAIIARQPRVRYYGPEGLLYEE